MPFSEKEWGTATRCTLKDSFLNLIKYVTYRQEKGEECLKLLVLFFASTAFVATNANLVKFSLMRK